MLWTQTRADTDMQKKRPNMPPGWNFTKTQKPTLLRCSAGEDRDVDANEEMKSEWTTFLSQLASAARTVVPAIGRPGVSYSNCLSIEHSYQTPLPHTPVLHIELQNSLKCCFPKRLGPNMKDEVYNFHLRRNTYKIDNPSQIPILFGHNSSFNFCFDKITHCTHQLHQLLFVFTIQILQSLLPPSAPLPPCL